MISVYIASPYSIGGKEENVKRSFEAYNELLKLDFMPFAPLTSHYIDQLYPQSWEQWLFIDEYWLSKCDCVLRLPGESKGADREVKTAELLNIPVFYGIDDLKNWNVI